MPQINSERAYRFDAHRFLRLEITRRIDSYEINYETLSIRRPLRFVCIKITRCVRSVYLIYLKNGQNKLDAWRTTRLSRLQREANDLFLPNSFRL